MILNDVRLAFKDIWMDKLKIVFYILYLTSTLYIIISVTDSIIENNEFSIPISYGKKSYVEFKGYLTSKDYDNTRMILKELEKIYQKGAITYYVDYDIRKNVLIYYIFGDKNFLPKEMQAGEKITCYGNAEFCKENEYFMIDNQKYPVKEVSQNTENFKYFGFSDVEDIIYVIQPYWKCASWTLHSSGNILYDIVLNTRIEKDNQKLQEQFLKVVNKSFMTVKKIENMEMVEEQFILLYIFPLLLSTLFCSMLFVYIILEGHIQKRKREITIYLLHGATEKDLYIRYGVYLLSIVIPNLILLDYCMNMEIKERIILIIAYAGIILTVIMLFKRVIKKVNLAENFRGDLV